MSRLLFGAFAVMCFLLSGTANAALYSQLSSPFVKTGVFDPEINDVVNFYLSQNDTNKPVDPIIGQVFDNFKLDADSSVTKINWVGVYSFLDDGIEPTFEISFYQDGSGGMPGTMIGSTLTGVNATENAQSDPGYFLYSANIAPVALLGGTNYWVSVMANVPVAQDFWGWAITGAAVDPSLLGSAQFYNGIWYKYPSTVVNGQQVLQFPPVDFAFSLDGTSANVIPEPMSALVFVGLIGGMAIYRRKKAISVNAS
jgi:hypothetical protein